MCRTLLNIQRTYRVVPVLSHTWAEDNCAGCDIYVCSIKTLMTVLMIPHLNPLSCVYMYTLFSKIHISNASGIKHAIGYVKLVSDKSWMLRN